MRVRFRKLSPDRHAFEIVRDDGSTSRTELETRSFLRHDLMHLALERRARLQDSLYGTLGKGAEPGSMRAAAPGAMPPTDAHAPEIAGTEVLVGMLQGAAHRGVDPSAFMTFASEWLGQLGQPVPPFLTADFVRQVLSDYERLHGQWQSLRIGGVLEIGD
jgi:hypothetical protein